MPGFSFVSNCGPGNSFSHQDCPRAELWADLGRYLKETGEIWEIFITFVLFSEVFFFPRSCRKVQSLREALRACPFPFCDLQPANDGDEIHFGSSPKGSKGSSENGGRLQEGLGKAVEKLGCS